MAVRDLHDVEGTKTPWQISELSECGEAVIEGAEGSLPKLLRSDRPEARLIVCELRMLDPENSDELMRVQIDARRIVAAVNFTANLPLEMLEGMAEEPLSPPASQGLAQSGYFQDEE